MQIISIDNNIKYNIIELIRPIIDVLNKEDKEKCFYIDEKEKKSDDYFIDFVIENELQSLIFEYDDKEPKNILMSQTINYFSEGGKFCLKKLYPNQESISFYFTVYIPEETGLFSHDDKEKYIVHKSYLGLLYNGYLYKKLIVESTYYDDYYPAEYNSKIMYFYIYNIKGIIQVSNLITNNFPCINLDEKNNNEENYQNLEDEKIDNIQLISLEGLHSLTKNNIEFEFNLKNIYNNEPVCMIYFASYMILVLNIDTLFLYPMLIKENTYIPIILKDSNIIQLEYLIFNFDSPIIIAISFEEMVDIIFSYSIEGTKRVIFNIFFSKNIITYQKEINEKCLKDKNDENRLCKIKIEIGKNRKSKFKKIFFGKTIVKFKNKIKL